MKVIGAILLTTLFCLTAANTARSGQLDPRLIDEIGKKPADELISVWIEVRSDYDSRELKTRAATAGATRAERHAFALTELKRRARNQDELLDRLQNMRNQRTAARVKGHWIVNIVEAEVAAGELESLATRDDVVSIFAAPEVTLIAPTATSIPDGQPADISGHPTNLDHVRAPEAWAMGFTGEGSLICSFDTGVEGNHPDLYGRWKGHDGDSAAAWFDPVFEEKFPHSVISSGSPFHGTHTLGIAVGASPSAGGDTVGVAPGAKWIAAAVIDIAGASILDAFEWAADPDGNPNTVDDVPDVISHSWGYKYMWCNNAFYAAIDHTEALGIVNIFSAGNEGQADNAIRSPADRAQDSLDCFAVGNLIHTSESIASLSSRGPSPCNPLAVKPNVVAPGTSITSCYYNYTSQLYSNVSGTSQAAPHVAGLVALLRQKNPNATVDEIKFAILNSTRQFGAWGPFPNNAYGWGEIDCVAALNMLSAVNPEPNVRVYDFDYPAITPGATVFGTVVLQNLGASVGSLTGTVLNTNEAVTIIDGSLTFGPIGEGDTVRSVDNIQFVVADTVTLGSILAADFVVMGSGINEVLQLHFLVGDLPGRSSATHTGSRISFTLTDYGAMGLATSSIFPLHGAGFTFDGGSNDLWEAGVMVGDSYSSVSSGVHSYLWDPDRDFKAVGSGDIEMIDPGPIAAEQTYAVFDDRLAKQPIGLQITQESFLRDSPNDDFVILRYILKNLSGESLSDVYFGLFMDFDLPTSYLSNAGGYESSGEFVWQAYNSGVTLSRHRGVKLFDAPLGAAGALDYAAYYHWPPSDFDSLSNGFSTYEKYGALSSGFVHADANKNAQEDIYIVVSAGPLSFAPGQLDTATFAIMAGNSLADLQDVAARAALIVSDVDDPGEEPALPTAFTLHQNYPNPFNPATVISFDLAVKSEYRFEIINVLGQTLYEEVATASPGRIKIEWDGDGYASGAYFYRLTVGERSEARKMMLLK